MSKLELNQEAIKDYTNPPLPSATLVSKDPITIFLKLGSKQTG